EEKNKSQIMPKKRKMSHKRSKKEWVIGQMKNNMGSFLEWEENKENLVYDNLSSSSITLTSKILKMRENEVEDVSPWIKRKNEGGWVTAIGFKHLKNMIVPEKKTRGKKELKEKQRKLMQALEKNQHLSKRDLAPTLRRSCKMGKRAGNRFREKEEKEGKK
ncbi:10184_t:CDS:2, partial [Gigaspora rosea]